MVQDATSELVLDVGDGQPIATAISCRHLRDKGLQTASFSVAQTQLYMELLENPALTPLQENDGFAFLILINAIAAAFFHKEVAAKNWHYQVNALSKQTFAAHELAAVESKYAQCDVLLLSQHGAFFNCLLLQALQLDEQKHLPMFTLIKVSDDRLFDFSGQCLTQFG
ncbi:hypothetical protein MACH26_19330 [Planctobacterium marinum]|uniref:Uncharacterized protein n=1 Tax=Planctobacterium marinum TaxID=1631968 RepID=A0AA48HMU6_9ALTE|nr:hypothetical protein MACH26_19330 [Planctobacterium marinum]